MKITTKEKNTKLEQLALNEIMKQADKFSLKNIVVSLRAVCDDNVTNEEIEEVVFNALDFAFSEGYIDIYDQYSYMVDPIKQIIYFQQEEKLL